MMYLLPASLEERGSTWAVANGKISLTVYGGSSVFLYPRVLAQALIHIKDS